MFRPLSREVTTTLRVYFVHSALETSKRFRLYRIQSIHSKLSLNCLTNGVTQFQKKVYIVLNHYRLEFMLVIFCSKKVIPKFSRKRFILDT